MATMYRGINFTGMVTTRGGTLDKPNPPLGNTIGLEDIVDFCIDNVGPEDTVLELGTYFGASTAIFSKFAKEVITVDIFIDRSREYLSTFNNIRLIQCNSCGVHHQFEPGLYNVLYVDTAHNYEQVTSELKALVPYGKSGARYGGHDYTKRFPGVVRAVDEFFGHPPEKKYKWGSWRA